MIAGGGTGGHLFPGIAVAEALRRRDGAAAVLFVGSERGIEARVVPQTGFALETLPIAPLRGRGSRDRLSALAALARSVGRARAIGATFVPDVIVGLGGYASAPAVVAGRMAGTPIVLLEQNARPGLTTRMLARLADRVCVSFAESASAFPPGKTVMTGNPVRWSAGTSTPVASPVRSTFGVLIFGGSAGARTLNAAGPGLRAALADVPGLRVVHQTGAEAERTVRAAYAAAGVEADVRPFIADMGTAYAAADLVVCRAGATTIAELAALGKPAILVPYPYAADDHQRANAESLVRAGAARMVLDAEATPDRLAAEVRALRAPGVLAEMSRHMRTLARPDAADRVLDTLEELIRGRSRGGRP